MSKYHSRKTIVDGITFDSKKESRRYLELKKMKADGLIKDFSCQPEFVLQEGYRRKDGKAIRPIKYIADFKVEYTDGRTEYEDTKGVKTEVFKIKCKLLERKYNLVLRIL